MTIQTEVKKLINKNKRKGVPKKLSKPKREDILKKMGFPEAPMHHHTWKVIGKTYAPPSNLSIEKTDISGATLEKAMFGLTTILWECPCGETKQVELLGNDEDLLESLINKADKIGPQFIERFGKTFIISEWKPQNQSPARIPIK